MHEGHLEREAALAELRERLADGLARARLTKTQLAQRAGLGRTTVQQAFRKDSPAPSAETVAALARVLRLPAEELLELRRAATGEARLPEDGEERGPGRPITEWEPHDLEVHPAGPAPGPAPAPGAAPGRVLPGYVRREHDQALDQAVQDVAEGRSRMLVLVGSSSTGKTRACWKAVQPLAARGWRLWHPFDPTRARAALEDLQRVRPRTVVWLNEAQHYLGDTRVGERIAAAVHDLLTDPGRAPVLVLGTLWPEYAKAYAALPAPGQPDPHSRVRELLASRTLTVPDTFTPEALRAAAVLAAGGDALPADALTRARDHGRLAQDLAGAPELLRRYQHGIPAARAVLEAAMDARRLGVGLHLLQAFLIDAAVDYLTDHDYDQLTDDRAEQAFADLAHPVHGKQAPYAGSPPAPGGLPVPRPRRPRLCRGRAGVPPRRPPRTARPPHPPRPVPARLLLTRRPHPSHPPRRPAPLLARRREKAGARKEPNGSAAPPPTPAAPWGTGVRLRQQ
ncbi:helix-turn-helix transcriptional regulator [Streptomyces macrosporus]|uniref:HTH cro/C1-type domain-containing protein n=1 Tax=Streptomyces macrosporus TaxID=44032 RepID=A0ABN3KKC4_9ACTN